MVNRRQRKQGQEEKPKTPLPRSDPILLTAFITGLWNFKGDLESRIKGASLSLHKQAPHPALYHPPSVGTTQRQCSLSVSCGLVPACRRPSNARGDTMSAEIYCIPWQLFLTVRKENGQILKEWGESGKLHLFHHTWEPALCVRTGSRV